MADFGIAEGLALFAAAATTTSVIMSAQSQKREGEAQAAVASNQAAAALDDAQAYAERTRNQLRKDQASARAAGASAGIDVGAGSAVRIDRDIAQRGEQDAFNAILTGDRQADTYNENASIYRANGNAAATAGYISAVGSVLGSGANLYDKWQTAHPPAPRAAPAPKAPAGES